MDIGAALRARREELGISLDDVQESTKIRTRYLAALEDNAFGHLPAEVYALGFLKVYARYLGLDADLLVGAWRAQRQPAEPPMSEPSTRSDETPTPKAMPLRPIPRLKLPPRPPAKTAWATGVVALIVVLGGLLFLMRHGSHQPPRQTAPTTSSHSPTSTSHHSNKAPRKPSETVTTTSTSSYLVAYRVSPGPAKLALTFSGPCWVEVWVNNVTHNPYGHIYTAGQSLSLTGSQSVEVLLGNPGVASGVANGHKIGTLGHPGKPRHVKVTVGS